MYTQTHTYALYVSVAELNLYLEEDVLPIFSQYNDLLNVFLSFFVKKKMKYVVGNKFYYESVLCS